MQNIILASASPRRKELLAQTGLTFEIIPARGEELITKTIPAEVVEELSMQKAQEIASQTPEGIIIGADTVVCQNGEIMGKPADEKAAWEMLRSIQGNTHSVFTGVTVIIKTKNAEEIKTFSCETKVHVFPMTEEETLAYIRTGEPMDKAGAYGIQGKFGKWVEKIEGDYNNVVGLPVSALWQVLKHYV